MPLRKPSTRVLRSLCAEVDAEDGLDPRFTPRGGSRKKPDRKVHQLCRQVAETLGLVLAGQSGDPVLNRLHVVSVIPGPDASRLLVTVGTFPDDPFEPGEVLGHLERAASWLRCEVASAITRKRAPLLAFRVAIPAAEPSQTP